MSEVRKCPGAANREVSWRLARTGTAQQQLFLEPPEHLRRESGTSYLTSLRITPDTPYTNLVGALGKKADVWADKHTATAVRQGATDLMVTRSRENGGSRAQRQGEPLGFARGKFRADRNRQTGSWKASSLTSGYPISNRNRLEATWEQLHPPAFRPHSHPLRSAEAKSSHICL